MGDLLHRVSEYDGEDTATIEAWAWAGVHPDRVRRQIFDEWLDFFSRPTPLRHLTLWCRVSDELLEALAPQTQLETLELKFGPFTDLSPLSGMSRLTELDLGGASSITDLGPLTALPQLVNLEVENTRKLHDYSPLARIPSLRRLSVMQSISGSRTDADSLAFLAGMTQLDELFWNPRVADRDYSPLLGLTQARVIGLWGVKGMTPSMVDLEWTLPGMQEFNRQRAEERMAIVESDGTVRIMTQDITGRTVFVDPETDELLDLYNDLADEDDEAPS